MTLKKMVLLLATGILILVGIVYFSFRTKSKDVSSKSPYSEIINRALITVQPCYIAKNYAPFVNENHYLLRMDYTGFSEDAGTIFKLPEGTSLKITGIKEFTKAVSGTSENMVLGTVYIAELKREVQFEFNWGNNPTFGLYDFEKNYDIYNLAPWQEEAISLKFFWDGHTEPHDWSTWGSPLQ